MLVASVTFFIMAVFIFVLGFFEKWGVSMEAAKIFFLTFLILSLVSFVAAVGASKNNRRTYKN